MQYERNFTQFKCMLALYAISISPKYEYILIPGIHGNLR